MGTERLQDAEEFLTLASGWSAPFGPELGGLPQPAWLTLSDIREMRFATGLRCTRCRSPHVQRWGSFAGRQRYRCVACGKTFSDLTGTPLMYSKRPELWGDFTVCMAESLTVRATAARLGIDKDTAWRWRHQVLEAELRRRGAPLRGIVETREVRVHTRTPRRGVATWWDGRPRRREVHPMWLLVARDRTGNTGATVSGSRRPRPEDFRILLGRRVARGRVVLQKFGRFGAAARYGRATGNEVRHAPAPPRSCGTWLFHLHNAGDYGGRLRVWLRRFRGVAPYYLARYLRWYALLEQTRSWPRSLVLDPLRPPLRCRSK